MSWCAFSKKKENWLREDIYSGLLKHIQGMPDFKQRQNTPESNKIESTFSCGIQTQIIIYLTYPTAKRVES